MIEKDSEVYKVISLGIVISIQVIMLFFYKLYFYEIIDEHRAKKAGYQVNLIAQALDAFYSNYDNTAIPLLEAVRIVSLAQDEETEKADLYLLKAQKRYKP